MIIKLILIVISTIECHVHVNVCTTTEVHRSEFFAWSDSSEEGGAEEKTIQEEDDDQTTTPQYTAEAPERGNILRPESLKVKRASSGSHLASFVTVRRRSSIIYSNLRRQRLSTRQRFNHLLSNRLT